MRKNLTRTADPLADRFGGLPYPISLALQRALT